MTLIDALTKLDGKFTSIRIESGYEVLSVNYFVLLDSEEEVVDVRSEDEWSLVSYVMFVDNMMSVQHSVQFFGEAEIMIWEDKILVKDIFEKEWVITIYDQKSLEFLNF